MKRVEIKLENRHLNFAAQLSFTRETTFRFIFFFFYFFVEGFAFLFHCIFFYFSRNSWSFSFSSILINFSSKIFIRFLQLKYFMRNISKLINMFRTSVSDLMTGTKSESFSLSWYITYWEKFVFKTDFIFSHGAFYLRGKVDKSSLLEKWSWKKYLCLKWTSKNCFLPLSLFDHLFYFFEKIFSYLEKKFVYFLKFLIFLYSLLNKKWYKELDKSYG